MYADWDATRLEVVRAGWGQVEEFTEDQVDDIERALFIYIQFEREGRNRFPVI